MKTKLTLILFLSFLMAGLSLAQPYPAEQDTVRILGGIDHLGSIETTINNDTTTGGLRVNPERVYLLEKDQFYVIQSGISFQDSMATLHIVGERGGAKPIVLTWGKDGVYPSNGGHLIKGSLHFENTYWINRWNNNVSPWRDFTMEYAVNPKLEILDCVIEFSGGLFVQANSGANNLNIFIKNTYARDATMHNNFMWGGRFVTSNFPADTLWVENSTFTNTQMTFGGYENKRINFVYFNHNTFINMPTWPIHVYLYEKGYFVNNIAVNYRILGTDKSFRSGQAPGGKENRLGIFSIDSLKFALKGYENDPMPAEEDREYFNSDNLIWYNPLMDHYYNGEYNDCCPYPISQKDTLNTQEEVVDYKMPFMDEYTLSQVEPFEKRVYQNLIEGVDPQLNTPSIANKDVVDSIAAWARLEFYGFGDEVLAGRAWYFGDGNPNTIPGFDASGNKTEEGVRGISKISDLIENFDYQSNVRSNIDGRKLGALHWEDGAMEGWDSEAEFAKVMTAYHSATDVEVESNMPSKFELSAAYPNPFNPSTTIEFTIPVKNHVTLKIYNVMGQKVATLVNGVVNAGAHKVTWDASNLSSGVYFYSLESANQKLTQKVMLLK